MKSRFSDEIFNEDSPNPMDGVANLADVMLVLAVGFMLALTIAWNVDIGSHGTDKNTNPNEIQQEVIIPGEEDEELDADTELENIGVVYRDPATGKLYIVENEGR